MMQATEEALTTIWEVLKYAVLIIGGGVGVEVVRAYFGKGLTKANEARTIADAANLHSSADSSTLTVSDKLLRQWMQDASAAAIEIAKLRKDLATAEICITDMSDLLLKAIKIMKEYNSNFDPQEFARFETEIQTVLKNVSSTKSVIA